MATSILNIPVPFFGDGPSVNVSSLVGEKTVSVTGSFKGQYVLLGSHNNTNFIPLLAFDVGGGDGIKLTTRGAVAWVKLRSLAFDSVGMKASISGLAIPGNNSFGMFPILGPGAYGPQSIVDLGLSDFQEDLNFICNGSLEGSVIVEGSLDRRVFIPIGSFSAEPSSASLLDAVLLEFAPVSTPDRIRYVRLNVQGVILTPFAVTIGGSQTIGGISAAQTAELLALVPLVSLAPYRVELLSLAVDSAELIALAIAGYPTPFPGFKAQSLTAIEIDLTHWWADIPFAHQMLQLLRYGRGETYQFATTDRTHYANNQTLVLTLLNAITGLFDVKVFTTRVTLPFTPAPGQIVVDLYALPSDSAFLVAEAWLNAINNLGGGALYWAQHYPVTGDAVSATLEMGTCVGDDRQNAPSCAPTGTALDPTRLVATRGHDSSLPLTVLRTHIAGLLRNDGTQKILTYNVAVRTLTAQDRDALGVDTYAGTVNVYLPSDAAEPDIEIGQGGNLFANSSGNVTLIAGSGVTILPATGTSYPPQAGASWRKISANTYALIGKLS